MKRKDDLFPSHPGKVSRHGPPLVPDHKITDTAVTQWASQIATAVQPLLTMPGYTLPVVAAEAATLTDDVTIYFGGLSSKAPSTTSGDQRIYIPRTGTLKAAIVFANAGTLGTTENWSLYLRKNGTSDTPLAEASVSGSNRTWSNLALALAVTAGDYIEIKSVNPAWATNPANVRFGGSIYIE